MLGRPQQREGLISNATNSKSLLFRFAFLRQFVSPNGCSVASQLFVLGLTQKASGLVVQGSGALASGAAGGRLASGAAGGRLARRPAFLIWQECCTGLVMVGLGLRMLFAGDGRPTRT